MCSLDLGIQMDMKIYVGIEKKFLLKMRNHNHPVQDNVLPFNNKGEDTCIDSQSSVDYLNKSLELIGVTN